MVELDDYQLLVLNHLKEITEKHENELLPILRENNFDLEVAVNHFMLASNHSISSLLTDITTADYTPNVRHRNVAISDSRSADANLQVDTSSTINFLIQSRQHGGIISTMWQFLTAWSPFRLLTCSTYYMYVTLRDILQFVASLFGVHFDERQVVDASIEVTKFHNYLKDTYINSVSSSSSNTVNDCVIPPLLCESYGDALKRTKRDLKFLLVYLHGSSHEDTDEFVVRVILNAKFDEFLKEHSNEIILWACNIESYEGSRVSQALREHTYPFLGLVCLQQRNISPSDPFEMSYSTQRLSLVGRVEGYDRTRFSSMAEDQDTSPVDYYISLIKDIMRENEATLVSARSDKEERESAQRLRREQDREFNETLEMDRRLKSEREAKRLAEMEAVEHEEYCEKTWALFKERIAEQEPTPLSMSSMDLSESGGDFVSLRIRLPSGQCFDRTFNIDDSCKLLHLYLLMLKESPRNFQVFSSFPKREVPCAFPGLECPLDMRHNELIHKICYSSNNNFNIWNYAEDVKEEDDPPSFKELGFGKKEMVLVIDLDA